MFEEIKTKVLNQFAEISTGTLFRVNVDNAKVWEVYLSAFTEENRQGNNCSCCRHFLYQFSGIVGIKENKIVTLWDFEVEDEEYSASVKAVGDYIRSLPIAGIFFNEFKKCGTDKNADPVRGVVWNHFFLELPTRFIKKDFGSLVGAALDNKNVLQRSLEEITDDAVDTVIELIQQGSLYRGNEFLGMVQEFRKVKENFKKTKKAQRENFCWVQSNILTQALCRIRNSSIGTLLNDLSEGRELDSAVSAFEKVVAPSNYKRPTALITPRMVEEAKKRLEEMGLTGSLYRRQLSIKDLTVNNVLFVDRKNETGDDIFTELKKDIAVTKKSLSKVDEVSIQDFIEKVVPTAKSIKVLVENRHGGNFVTLIGPKNEEDKSFLKWDNNFSWSYSGAVADSMRERVVELGGRVDGVLRFTHSWNHQEVGRNASLMDLHVFLPGSSPHKDGISDIYPTGQRVGWNNRKDAVSGGVQDVDYTNPAPEGYIPIENITFPSINKLKDGKYTFKIHNWQLREPTKSGFKAEIEFGGEIFHYNYPKPLKHKEWLTLAEVTLNNGTFSMNSKLESDSCSQTKWNITTERFCKVNAICLSPNYWDCKSGNKHFFFILDNCKAEGDIRGFYNEFLKEDLSKDRKVFEVLGSKVKVETAEGHELSGLGFSETVRNHIFVEVTGKFKRTIKVKF